MKPASWLPLAPAQVSPNRLETNMHFRVLCKLLCLENPQHFAFRGGKRRRWRNLALVYQARIFGDFYGAVNCHRYEIPPWDSTRSQTILSKNPNTYSKDLFSCFYFGRRHEVKSMDDILTPSPYNIHEIVSTRSQKDMEISTFEVTEFKSKARSDL